MKEKMAMQRGEMSRRDFLAAGAMAGAFLPAAGFCGNVSGAAPGGRPLQRPVLRVGIMSDTQSYPGRASDPGQIAMRRAMEQLKARNIDVLLVNGDISDNGKKKVYEEYREIVREVFGSRPPVRLPIMGNHDYWNGMKVEDAQKNFMDGMGLDAISFHKIIAGYDFISVSPDCGASTEGSYHKESAEFMKREVAAAFARDPGKPIFVSTHQHAADTVYGSHEYWGTPEITEILKGYENVLLFSGHSHFPLDDERTINQKDFSAVGTSSLAYCELERGPVNGSVPPNAGRCKQYLYMEVFPERLEISRFAVETGREIKPGMRWVLPLPLKKGNFVYTDKRAESRRPPAFPEGAKAAVEVLQKSRGVQVTFTAARHDDFVHTYRIKVFERTGEGAWKESGVHDFFSDFYCGVEKMADPYRVTIPAKFFPGAGRRRLEIFPVESFGKTGAAPIAAEFTLA